MPSPASSTLKSASAARTDRLGNPIVPYDPARFDEGYYTRGERGGFKDLDWNNAEQQNQLRYKFGHVSRLDSADGVADVLGNAYKSILFVGCARGLEVRYFRERGKDAAGVDVSEWAIANADPEAAPHVRLYDGVKLPWLADSSVDVVAAFDVLTLVPHPQRQQLVAEIVRVAGKGICFRTIVKDYRNLKDNVDGLDGTSFVYSTLEWWDRMFTGSGKFRMKRVEMTGFYEGMFWFGR